MKVSSPLILLRMPRAGRTFLLLLGITTWLGCDHGGAHGPTAEKKDVPLDEIQAELLTVDEQAWPSIVRVQGTLVADELTTVGAKVPGRVVDLHVDLGDRVVSGQPLVTVDQTEFKIQVQQAESQLLQVRAAVGLKPGDPVSKLDPQNAPPVREARAVWDEARTQSARARELRARQALSELELDQTIAAEHVAEARFASALNAVNEKIALIGVQEAELARARQLLEETVTIAPYDGEVQGRLVGRGAYVQIGQPLVSLVRTGTLRFRAMVPERYAQQISLGQQLVLTVESRKDPYQIVVSRVSPALDSSSRSLAFEANLENVAGDLRAGLFCEAELTLDPQARAVAIPPSAVVEFAGVEKVWKVVEGVATEERVEVGRRGSDLWEIRRGLTVGDTILVDGKQGKLARVKPKTSQPPAETATATAPAAPAG